MFDNNDLPNGGVQFAMSHEVIALLQWLTDNHAEKLEPLIKKAVADGLLTRMKESVNSMDDAETHMSILDFFAVLEIMVYEEMQAQTQKQAHNSHLQNTIDQIDGAFCDTGTVKASLECTTNNLAANPEKSPKELLFKELLKQWRPNNSQIPS